MNKIIIPILLATGRANRQSEKVAKYVLVQALIHGFDSELVDVRNFATPVTIEPEREDPLGLKWSAIVRRMNGLIIVAPEYNSGYPGELKVLLDKSYEEYRLKPVAICGVSSGDFGGARMVEHLRPVLVRLGMLPLQTSVYFSNVKELFNEQGEIQDKTFARKMEKLFAELLKYLSV
ncbi:MAG: NAD(P)H-dependent oxidoreductase [Patescibacteria group bacterium]